MGGSTTNEGYVMVWWEDRWLPLYWLAFGPRTAGVVCRQLGYSGGATIKEPGSFGDVPFDSNEFVYIGCDNPEGGCSDGNCSADGKDLLKDCSGAGVTQMPNGAGNVICK